MGLTAKGWSSGGDIMCQYDYSNGGHWIFTEFVSASTEASGGPFSGCFAGVANTCYEGIAVTKGNSPFGPYNVYYLNSNYNPAEPGAPYLLNDFTKIGVSRDAFLLFYDEFPLVTAGIGGGFFNGAQEFAIDKNALEKGLPVSLPSGKPNPFFNVAIENMGTLPTPDGTCASDNATGAAGVTCWFSVIPAMPPDPSQYDNSHGGSAFMLDSLDFFGQGDSRIAVFDWTGLSALDSPGCVVLQGAQVRRPAVLRRAAVLRQLRGRRGPAEGRADSARRRVRRRGAEHRHHAAGQLPRGPGRDQRRQLHPGLAGTGPAVGRDQHECSRVVQGLRPETHQGAAYWVIGTDSFDRSGVFRLTGQGYVAPAHEDLAFPDIAAGDSGPAALFFTLTGDGGPTGADNGGFYPSTAFGRLFAGSSTLLASKVSVADPGQSPTDGFSEYQGYPGRIGPRWGDYSAGVYDPGSGKIFFSTNYIQYPNCAPPAFTLALATCGGTRDGFANWGTSVNSVAP